MLRASTAHKHVYLLDVCVPVCVLHGVQVIYPENLQRVLIRSSGPLPCLVRTVLECSPIPPSLPRCPLPDSDCIALPSLAQRRCAAS